VEANFFMMIIVTVYFVTSPVRRRNTREIKRFIYIIGNENIKTLHSTTIGNVRKRYHAYSVLLLDLTDYT
jgi:hypothetical protein